jgi:hypothetical protein
LIEGSRSPDAASVAEGLLGWAKSKQARLGPVRYRQSAAIIETPGPPADRLRLFRITYDGEVRVSHHTLSPQGDSWNGESI